MAIFVALLKIHFPPIFDLLLPSITPENQKWMKMGRNVR